MRSRASCIDAAVQTSEGDKSLKPGQEVGKFAPAPRTTLQRPPEDEPWKGHDTSTEKINDEMNIKKIKIKLYDQNPQNLMSPT